MKKLFLLCAAWLLVGASACAMELGKIDVKEMQNDRGEGYIGAFQGFPTYELSLIEFEDGRELGMKAEFFKQDSNLSMMFELRSNDKRRLQKAIEVYKKEKWIK